MNTLERTNLNNIHDTVENRERYEGTTSPRFNSITTGDVLGQLKTLGWVPVSAQIQRTREADRRPYARHLVTLQRGELATGNERQLGDTLPRINLKNANDGTSSFEVFAGFYRLVCLNGLMVGTTYATVRIRHSLGRDKLADALAAAVATTEEQISRGEAAMRQWRGIALNNAQRLNLAEYAVSLRWGSFFSAENLDRLTNAIPSDYLGGVRGWMRREFSARAEHLATPRRSEDSAGDLWTTFNRIQENVIRGGFHVELPRMLTGGLEMRPRKMRTLTSINDTVRINRALWDAGEKIAKGESLEIPAVLVS